MQFDEKTISRNEKQAELWRENRKIPDSEEECENEPENVWKMILYFSSHDIPIKMIQPRDSCWQSQTTNVTWHGIQNWSQNLKINIKSRRSEISRKNRKINTSKKENEITWKTHSENVKTRNWLENRIVIMIIRPLVIHSDVACSSEQDRLFQSSSDLLPRRAGRFCRIFWRNAKNFLVRFLVSTDAKDCKSCRFRKNAAKCKAPMSETRRWATKMCSAC